MLRYDQELADFRRQNITTARYRAPSDMQDISSNAKQSNYWSLVIKEAARSSSGVL